MDSEKKIVDLDSFVIEFVKYIDYPESCHLSNSIQGQGMFLFKHTFESLTNVLKFW